MQKYVFLSNNKNSSKCYELFQIFFQFYLHQDVPALSEPSEFHNDLIVLSDYQIKSNSDDIFISENACIKTHRFNQNIGVNGDRGAAKLRIEQGNKGCTVEHSIFCCRSALGRIWHLGNCTSAIRIVQHLQLFVLEV